MILGFKGLGIGSLRTFLFVLRGRVQRTTVLRYPKGPFLGRCVIHPRWTWVHCRCRLDWKTSLMGGRRKEEGTSRRLVCSGAYFQRHLVGEWRSKKFWPRRRGHAPLPPNPPCEGFCESPPAAKVQRLTCRYSPVTYTECTENGLAVQRSLVTLLRLLPRSAVGREIPTLTVLGFWVGEKRDPKTIKPLLLVKRKFFVCRVPVSHGSKTSCPP